MVSGHEVCQKCINLFRCMFVYTWHMYESEFESSQTDVFICQYSETNVMHFFIQFLKNLGPLHVSNVTCSSSGGTPQTARYLESQVIPHLLVLQRFINVFHKSLTLDSIMDQPHAVPNSYPIYFNNTIMSSPRYPT
jgi:hypothetical protein